MTAQDQCTPFYTNCTVNELDGCFHITSTFDIRARIAFPSDELDTIIAFADHAGQLVNQNIATTTLERADQRAAELSLGIFTNTANAPSL